MKAQRRKKAGFDMDERYRLLGTFRVRRTGLKAGASSRSPNASRGLEAAFARRRVSDIRWRAGAEISSLPGANPNASGENPGVRYE